ncbi:unnamed protein product, partial [marine sediment metagenome]
SMVYLNFDDMNSVSYGSCFPHTIDENGDIILDDAIIQGGNFLDNSYTGRKLNTLFSEDYNFLRI